MTFQQALKAVTPHVSKDSMSPILGSVLIKSDRAIATDRFTIGVSRYGDDTADRVSVPADGVPVALSSLKPVISDKDTVARVEYVEADNTVRVSMYSGGQYVLPISYGTYPAVERLMTKREDIFKWINRDTPARTLSLKPEHMVKFKATALARTRDERKNSSVVFLPGEHNNSPLMVTFSSHFMGAVMPVRFGDIDAHLADWDY